MTENRSGDGLPGKVRDARRRLEEAVDGQGAAVLFAGDVRSCVLVALLQTGPTAPGCDVWFLDPGWHPQEVRDVKTAIEARYEVRMQVAQAGPDGSADPDEALDSAVTRTVRALVAKVAAPHRTLLGAGWIAARCQGDGPAEARVQDPLADWTEAELWTYVKAENVPYCALYDLGVGDVFAHGLRMRHGPTPEARDIEEKLRKLGYL